ncbi:MAG TPA: hypothetical protein VHY08_00940 [Bacillota bacterium]|nr:hypothetical protein [Bacillota bacterium]
MTEGLPLFVDWKENEGKQIVAANIFICVSNADAISQITNPIYWLYFAFHIRNYDFETGREWLLNRIENNWDLLIKPAKELVEVRYNTIKRLLAF